MRSFAPLLLCIVFSVLQCALGEDVANAADGPIELTADSFDQIVDGSREAFVKFFAPCMAMLLSPFGLLISDVLRVRTLPSHGQRLSRPIQVCQRAHQGQGGCCQGQWPK